MDANTSKYFDNYFMGMKQALISRGAIPGKAGKAVARRHYRGLTWLGHARRAGGALHNLIVQPYFTTLLDSLIGQPYFIYRDLICTYESVSTNTGFA